MINDFKERIAALGLKQSASRSSVKEPASPLTKRILGVNILAIVILGMGFLYLGQYQKDLIEKEITLLAGEARIMGTALNEAGYFDEHVSGERQKEFERYISSLAKVANKKAIVFNDEGAIIANSERYFVAPTSPRHEMNSDGLFPQRSNNHVLTVLNNISGMFLNLLPGGDIQRLDLYPYTLSFRIQAYPLADEALRTTLAAGKAYRSYEDDLVLVTAVPILKGEKIFGVMMLEKDGRSIAAAVNSLRRDVLVAFLGGLLVTVLLSFYLSGTIAHPLRELAKAADEVRRSKKRKTDIPDFSVRQDEIAMLSESLRDMTEALWNRMDAIESFAADVSHELKNPLTSLKSAIETVGRVKDPEKKNKLMDIIHHDINRLDRLITDISEASRVDSELSKAEMQDVALDQLLGNIVKTYQKRDGIGHDDEPVKASHKVVLNDNKIISPALVKGNQNRLNQVFQNLIDNGISFSPKDTPVGVEMFFEEGFYIVRVYDRGPGIPLENMDKIFKRFYTERPEGESFGNHSGLGLSIVRQIVEAHGGKITVNNIYAPQGHVMGCEFLVFLPAAKPKKQA